MSLRIGVCGVVIGVTGAVAAGLGAKGYHEMSAGAAASTVVGEKPGKCCDPSVTEEGFCKDLPQFTCKAPPVNCFGGIKYARKQSNAGCLDHKDDAAECLLENFEATKKYCIVDGSMAVDCDLPGNGQNEGQQCRFKDAPPDPNDTDTIVICGNGTTLCYCHFIYDLDLPSQLQDELFRLCEEIENEMGL